MRKPIPAGKISNTPIWVIRIMISIFGFKGRQHRRAQYYYGHLTSHPFEYDKDSEHHKEGR